MAVHSLHVFDRKGKTLFTKRYLNSNTSKDSPDSNYSNNAEQLAEQRKLVFGMLFSLREVAASLSPDTTTNTAQQQDKSLHSVQTGASILYSYETNSGLRFALYTTTAATSSSHTNYNNSTNNNALLTASGGHTTNAASATNSIPPPSGGGANSGDTPFLSPSSNNNQQQQAISIRAALKHIYHDLWIQCVTRSYLYRPSDPNVSSTNFEQELDSYLGKQPWFR